MNSLITQVTSANPSTVVVIQSGTPVSMPFLSTTPALLHAWYGGNETGNAIADIIFGNVNPSAKLPLSFPKRIQDNPAFLSFRSERGRAIYGEDVYVGYRWYEALELPVLFPFGHGLSYTSFSFSDLKVEKGEKNLSVKVKIENTGSLAGAEVVQVYVSQKNPSIKRPPKELKGFSKAWLDKGEEKVVEVNIEVKYAVSFWDEVRNAWISEFLFASYPSEFAAKTNSMIVEKDVYEVIVGGSSEEGIGEVHDSF